MLKRTLLTLLLPIVLISCDKQNSEPFERSDLSDFLHLKERFEKNSVNPDSTIYISQKLLALVKDQANDSLLSEAYLYRGTAFETSQLYDSSVYYFKKALEISSSISNKNRAYNGLGSAYYFLGQLDSALHFYQKSAEQIAEPEQSKQYLSMAYSNIGKVLNASDLDTEAIDYFKRAIQIAKDEDLIMQELPPLLNISTVFMKSDQFDSAIHYALEVERRSLENEIPYGVAKANYVLATAHLGLNRPSRALNESLKAEEIYLEINSPRDLNSTRFLRAKILHELSSYAESLHLINNLEGPFNDGLREQILEYKAKNLFGLKKWNEAYKAYEEFHNFYAQVVEKNREGELAALQYQFDTKAKTAEIRSLQNENTIAQLQLNQRNMWIITICILMILAIAFGLMYLKNSRIRNEKQVADLETKLLRTQLNPHFLFNAMGAIQQYIFSKEEPQKISDYLGKFSRLTRMILNYSKEEFISLEEEITFIYHYVELQQIRFENPFDFELIIDPELDQEETLIPPMLTQPFIENAIEHGLLHKKSKGLIKLKITEVSSDEIEVIVEDDGVGRKQAASFKKHANHRSFATEITKERLKLLQSKLNKRTNFKIIDLVDNQEQSMGTRIHLNIPLIKA